MAKVLSVKVMNDEKGEPGSCVYKNKVNFSDFKQIALVFFDLEVEGADIENAFKEFKRKKEEGWPF